jgi:two-component system response regulator
MKQGMIDVRWGDRPIEILLVEDNPGDVEITQRILKDSKFEVNFTVAEDGEVAMAYLNREPQFEGTPRPDLVMLDLSLPRKNGMEVLAEMGANPDFTTIPVIILTSTNAEQELLKFDNFDPSRYCSKPIDLHRFNGILDKLTTTFSI